MMTETLIRELAAQIQPVRRLGHPLARFGRWVTVAAAWLTGSVATSGVRVDFAEVWRDPTFLLHAALPAALGAVATIAAFVTSVPDRRSRWSTLIPAALMASWLLLVLTAGFPAGEMHVGAGLGCVRNLLAFAVPPGLLLCFMLRRAAPLEGGHIGLLAALGVAALANVGTRFVCHNDGALHVLVWHFGFVLLLGGLGLLVGRLLVR